ncbi:U3 small nucleolar RNA-associated protein 9 [Nakaseomyces bracarensis]|uniref:U3 small nucleolar RNA-associated protein 9 n=1 Tax=Nakaseomyces bracarensis TaxID=273131 RepID=A0ABR4NMX2_9SACH
MLTDISSFSEDGMKFAYQGGVSKKNIINIYPLDPENNYQINSSLVDQIDCESNDLNLSELQFYGWCYNESSAKTKRSNSNEVVKNTSRDYENYFVNVFDPTKVVVYTETGKDIVNILKSKDKVIGMGIEGPYIWLLDENMVTKKYHYQQNKQLKSFTFSEAKNENIINFQVLQADEKTIFIVICSEEKVYIVDPSKRRASTKLTIDLNSCTKAVLLDNNKFIALRSFDGITVYDFSTGKEVYRWEINDVPKLASLGGYIVALSSDRESIDILKIGESDAVGTIIAGSAKIIDFTTSSGTSLLISWLNVNEPNFKNLTIKQIVGGGITNINENVEKDTEEAVNEEEHAGTEVVDKKNEQTQKISKAGQDKISQSLITALIEGEDGEILANLELETWTPDRISIFVNNKLEDQDQSIRLYSLVAKHVEENVWNTNPILSNWLKWLMLYKGTELDSTTDKKVRKQTKHLKSALKTSTSTLPILLGIQGRLEMLKTQAQLRRELAELTLEQDDTEFTENNITYVDGEGDNFVDAPEYLEAK